MAKRDQGKTIAILSYITPIGWIIALIMNSDAKSAFAKYHLRQTLLLYIAYLIFSWVPWLWWMIIIVLFIFWLIGLIGAVNGQKKEMPLIGSLAQDWFKGL